MKIAILTSGILPVPAVKGGAVENHIDIYLKYNDEHKLHDITVFSISDEDTKSHPALRSTVNHYVYIETNRFWDKFLKFFFKRRSQKLYYHYTIEYYFYKAWKLLRKNHYDIILLDNRPGYSLNIKCPKGTSLCYYLHNDILNQQTNQAQLIYKAADKIITVSDYISSCVRTINPHDKKCIRVHNGSDINLFYPNRPATIDRNCLNLSNNDFIIFFSGRVIPEKGVLELIKAVKQLKQFDNIKLLIVGSPFYGNAKNESNYIQELKHEAETMKEHIFITGYIPYLKLPEYLWISDIAVVPSLWEEPFGNTVVEAMAAGLPLITTRSGGIPEICEGVAKIIDRGHIVDNLASAILYLYKHPGKRKQMASAGLERAKLFDKETYAKNFFKALGGI